MPRYPVPERGPHLDFSRLIAKRIAERRRALGMSQETLGQHLSVTRDLITRIETNRAQPNAGDMPALAMALGVSVGYFYEVRSEDDTKIVTEASLGDLASSDFQLPFPSSEQTRRAEETVRQILSAIVFCSSVSSPKGDSEVSEMFSMLDADLAEAFLRMARVIYDLQLKRPVSHDKVEFLARTEKIVPIDLPEA